MEELQREVTRLRAEVAQLRARAEEGGGPRREKIAQMSSLVTDSNPYSRLMALKKMGICDYERIRDFAGAEIARLTARIVFFFVFHALTILFFSSGCGGSGRRRIRGGGNARSMRHWKAAHV